MDKVRCLVKWSEQVELKHFKHLLISLPPVHYRSAAIPDRFLVLNWRRIISANFAPLNSSLRWIFSGIKSMRIKLYFYMFFYDSFIISLICFLYLFHLFNLSMHSLALLQHFYRHFFIDVRWVNKYWGVLLLCSIWYHPHNLINFASFQVE